MENALSMECVWNMDAILMHPHFKLSPDDLRGCFLIHKINDWTVCHQSWIPISSLFEKKAVLGNLIISQENYSMDTWILMHGIYTNIVHSCYRTRIYKFSYRQRDSIQCPNQPDWPSSPSSRWGSSWYKASNWASHDSMDNTTSSVMLGDILNLGWAEKIEKYRAGYFIGEK